MTAPVTQLRPPGDRRAAPPPPNRWVRRSTLNYTPAALASTITQLERGETEPWADLAEYMLRTDAHTRSVYNTLLQSVAAAEMRWEPADETPEAQAAADFVTEAWNMVRNRGRTLLHLLHGEGVGWSIAEHEWQRVKTTRGYAWLSLAQHAVQARDVKFDYDWTPAVRSWERRDVSGEGINRQSGSLPGVSLNEQWYRVDEEPDRWLVHVPGAVGISPQLSGLLLACAWPWLFKHWNVTFRQQAMERFGAPTPYATADDNADKVATDELHRALEKLSAGHAIVIRQGQTIELLESSDKAGESFALAITHQENEITKAILGSTVNVEGASTGGNGSRAVAESQADTTIGPRLRAIGDRLEQTMERDFAAPTLSFNARLFNGRVPPMPRCVLEMEREEPPVITQLLIDAGVVTANELRRSANLEEWTTEQGGDRVVTPVAKTAPTFERERREAGTPDTPFARAPGRGQMTLPLTSVGRKTSPTSSGSPTRSEAVPWPESGGPAKRR